MHWFQDVLRILFEDENNGRACLRWTHAGTLTVGVPQERLGAGGARDQPSNRVTIMEALWPPKPKELLTTPVTRISRAVCGT